jgi:hypothetical protein
VVDFWDNAVTKKVMTLPDEVEVQSPDGSPLDGDGADPCIIKLDVLTKRHLAMSMINSKQSFETTFRRFLSKAIKGYASVVDKSDAT